MTHTKNSVLWAPLASWQLRHSGHCQCTEPYLVIAAPVITLPEFMGTDVTAHAELIFT